MNTKRIILAIAIATALCGNYAKAQAPTDSLRTSQQTEATIGEDGEENVVGARRPATRQHSGEANVLGLPVYYNTDGFPIGEGGEPSPSGGLYYQRPKHHYMNSLKDQFNSFFCEFELMAGMHQVGFGVNFAYLPNRWGAYASVLNGTRHDYVTVGPVLRLSDSDNIFDWQLYGGLLFGGSRPGCEMGIRWAMPHEGGGFCMTSWSMGVAMVNGDAYFTLGGSLDITLCAALLAWLL